MKQYLVQWTYESSNFMTFENGAQIVKAKSTADAEDKFYTANQPNKGPECNWGFSVESIEQL